MLLKFLSLTTAFLWLTACNSMNYKISEDSHTENYTKIEKEVDRPLCKYREVKGISEVLASEREVYEFMFFPGDHKFTRSHKALAMKFSSEKLAEIEVGSEIRSVKQSLVSGHEQCLKVEIQLIPTLPH